MNWWGVKAVDELWRPIDELWRPDERFITTCAKCGREGLKKRMHSLYIKQINESAPHILCHVCDRCLTVLLDELEVSVK